MTLVETLQGYAAQMPGNPVFVYKRKSEQNAEDNLDYSNGLINLLEVDQPGFLYNTTTGTLHNRWPCFIQFVKKIEQDSKASDRDAIVQEMSLLAATFIRKIDQEDLFQFVQPVIPGVMLANYYDSNVVGIEINLVLTPNEPMAICI